PPVRWKLRLAIALTAAQLYTTTAAFALSRASWLSLPVALLAPFRVSNAYGLFAVMTPSRFEIEFQGSRDGVHFAPYRFRRKPQALDEPPGIYAPLQPRFDWNLWFASLATVEDYPWVTTVEEKLLAGEPSVLALFAGDPFAKDPPTVVRAVVWQ